MRIGYVTDGRGVWGAERSLLGLVSEADAHGHKAQVIVQQGSPFDVWLQENVPSMIVRRVDLPLHPGANRAVGSAGIAGLVREAFATVRSAAVLRGLARDYDVLVSFELWRNLDVTLATVGTKTAAMVDVHDVVSGVIGKRIGAIVRRLGAGVLAPSQYTLKAANLAGPRSAVIPRGYDAPPIVRSLFDPERPVFAILGELRPYKQPMAFLEAFVIAESARPGARVLVVGGDQGDPALVAKVAEIAGRHPNAVQVVARVKDVSTIMGGIDVVVNSSEYEAFGRTLIEGLAHGALPVAMSPTGPAEIIDRAGIGRLLNGAAAADDLAVEIIDLIDDRALIARASREGPAIAREKFGWKVVGTEYYSAVTELTRRS